MEIAAHMAALRREGDLLATAAERVALDTPVPTCPKWRLRDLLRHVGGVHRWATARVREQRQQPMDAQEAAALMRRWPEDAALVAWFREGHVALVQTLEMAPPDLACWTFLPAPSPLTLWARR